MNADKTFVPRCKLEVACCSSIDVGVFRKCESKIIAAVASPHKSDGPLLSSGTSDRLTVCQPEYEPGRLQTDIIKIAERERESESESERERERVERESRQKEGERGTETSISRFTSVEGLSCLFVRFETRESCPFLAFFSRLRPAHPALTPYLLPPRGLSHPQTGEMQQALDCRHNCKKTRNRI
jgi:hypothetical protein